MTRLERYKEQLASLEAKRSVLMRSGKLSQYYKLGEDIKEVEENIKRAEEYEEATRSRPVAEILSHEEIDEMGIIPMMIECHLIADMLVESTYRIVDACNEHGLSGIKLAEDLVSAIKANEVFASFLTKMSPELSNLLVRNETFNASLHKKYLKYIEQRLTPRKTKNHDKIDS